MEIRSVHTIQTAERVPLTLELAGAPARVLAFVIDLWVMLCLLGLVVLVLNISGGMLSSVGLAKTWVSEGLNTIVPLLVLVFFFCFHFFQEWLWHGKTLGKSLLKIRVARNNGQPIGFWEAFGRNLFRLVDVYMGGLGLFPMLISRSEKRFGDYLVGTLVIQDSPEQNRRIARPQLATQEEGSVQSVLTLEEQELLRSFFQRKSNLTSEEQTQLDQALRLYFAHRLNRSPEDAATDHFLDRLIEPNPTTDGPN